jgi:hypothetical protein
MINRFSPSWAVWVMGGILLLSSSSCALFRKGSRADREERAWRATLAKTETNRLAFNTLSLSGKARISGETGDMGNLSINYRIDLRRDSVMTIRLNKFIEVARIQLDHDSIRVINRLEQTYSVCGYQLAEDYTGLKANFEVMQGLFLGEFTPIPTNLAAEKINGTPQAFTGSKAGTFFRYLIDPLILRLVGIESSNEIRQQASIIQYTDFEAYGKTQMPQTIAIQVTAPSQLEVSLSHRKMRIDEELNLSFEVPGNFKRKACDF